MDYTRLATVTIYTNNLTPMPKISCWFVFILICGRREHSKKKKHFVRLRTAMKAEIISLTLQIISINPYSFDSTKSREDMIRLKQLVKKKFFGKAQQDHSNVTWLW